MFVNVVSFTWVEFHSSNTVGHHGRPSKFITLPPSTNGRDEFAKFEMLTGEKFCNGFLTVGAGQVPAKDGEDHVTPIIF